MRVLVVDDNDGFRLFLVRLVESTGAEAIAAASGADAMARMAETWPDVIFTDINMPEMDGLELLAAVKAQGGDAAPPVIAVTSAWSEHALNAYLGRGFDWAIEKPVRPASILHVLAAITRQAASATAVVVLEA